MDPKHQNEQTQWARRAGPVARGPWSGAREPQKTKQTQFPCFWARNAGLGEKQTQSGRVPASRGSGGSRRTDSGWKNAKQSQFPRFWAENAYRHWKTKPIGAGAGRFRPSSPWSAASGGRNVANKANLVDTYCRAGDPCILLPRGSIFASACRDRAATVGRPHGPARSWAAPHRLWARPTGRSGRGYVGNVLQ